MFPGLSLPSFEMEMIRGIPPPQNVEKKKGTVLLWIIHYTLNISGIWWVHLSSYDRKSNRGPQYSLGWGLITPSWVGGTLTSLQTPFFPTALPPRCQGRVHLAECPVPPPPQRAKGRWVPHIDFTNPASLLPSGRTRGVRGRPCRHGHPQPPAGQEGRTRNQLPDRGPQEPQRERLRAEAAPRGGPGQASFPSLD